MGDTQKSGPDRGVNFLMNLSETDDCILWPFFLNPDGYGVIHFNGRNRPANRISLLLSKGSPPKGAVSAHSCGVRACVNPRHLRWASHKSNHADRISHGTSMRAHPSVSTLTVDNALQIKKAIASGLSDAEIAKGYEVTRCCIRKIRICDTWSHVACPEFDRFCANNPMPPARSRKLSHSDKEAILARLDIGERASDLADEYQVHRNTIYRMKPKHEAWTRRLPINDPYEARQ